MTKRCLTILLASLFVALSIQPPASTVNAQQTSAAPASSSTLRLAGLREQVTVRRDERGIPYIEAANEADLYFAQGYVTANDRLWQMELLRRNARGELSEIFGARSLEDDKRRRAYGFASIAEGLVAQAAPPVRASLEAYARGVNAYIESLDAKSLPPEFQILQFRPRAWTPADSIVLGKNFAEALSTTWFADISRAAFADLPPEKFERLFPVTSEIDVILVGTDKVEKKAPSKASRIPSPRAAQVSSGTLADSEFTSETLRALAEVEELTKLSLATVGLDADSRAASNNWVVSGKHTATGKPLLANDPHLSPSAPSIWYMTHLSAPGLRVAGVTSPGAPGVIIGHNERIAWGVTNLGPDVQDVYVENFDAENPRRYMTPAGWREAEVRREEIKVRKSLTGTATDVVPFDVTVTRHGPIVFEKDGKRYALRWTALDPKSVDFEGFYFINRARNPNEFREALKNYQGPTQNFVYADVDGHIGYYGAGRIPVRKSGDGSVPFDGSTDAGEWTSYIPFDELPHVFDPPSGIIVTANSRIVGTSYRHHLTHNWFAPVRARRIQEMLAAKKKMTATDFRDVLGDTRSISAKIFAREVVKLGRANNVAPGDQKWRETLQMLDVWDGRIEPESREALLAHEMRERFRGKVLTAAVGEGRAKAYRWGNTATFLDRLITEKPAAWLPAEYKNYSELIYATHTEARASLAERYGVDETKWIWGRQAQVNFPHPLAAVPVIGGAFLVAPFPQRGSSGALATVNVGAAVSMRLIADTSNWDSTQHGLPLGQSGNPSSPHWKDQLADWQSVTPRAFPFNARAVASATKETIVLAPK